VGTVARAFPHLGRGLEARRARKSDLFTIYDGYVPEAGADLDPTKPEGPVLSASRLEVLGRCPLEYFFAYVLGVEPPQEYTLDPSRWLEPSEKGSLLHSVFQRFHQGLLKEGRRPAFERDLDFLQGILEDEIGLWVRRKPPPSREVFDREADDLRRCIRIFLFEEEEHCRGRRPLYFEVAIGMETGSDGNPVDSPQAVEIELPGGKTIRTRGFIDRIDELGEPGSLRFAVCDYKTGSSYGYRQDDPFRQGRRIQNLMYMKQAQSRLAEFHPGAEVDSFQYFFPSTREHGERIAWDSETLASGIAVLEKLCEMLARGCFPFTDDDSDLFISDLRTYFGDIESATDAVKTKMCNRDNENLAPFRELRGYEE
jgi:ATP-dependent helicase/nuclease subunit B